MRTKRTRGAKASPRTQEATTPGAVAHGPVIVGIGASAGGLDAFSRILQSLPADTGMAFVLVQHLDPRHPSLLAHLLQGKTAMAVSEATDGSELAADHVYVSPPGPDLLLRMGRLRLTPRDPDAQVHLPIDGFLRSLAEDAGERAIGVVLSGAASDGTQGLAAVKSAGGVTFAQDPSSAEYPSMPVSAVGARVVDFVLPPEQIAHEIARLGAAGGEFGGADASRRPEGEDEAGPLEQLFALLHDAFRVDFSAYKLPTIRRRVERRMLVRRVEDLAEYVGLLAEDTSEVEALYRDILIMVTEFFREPETFAVLRDRVVPDILQGKTADDVVRIWVPGCASGEEAYSLAITLLEAMEERRLDLAVKVFASDISEPDLAHARRGLYMGGIASNVAPDLLRRYFVRTESGYQIGKSVRELCVFARHDVTSDPPFPNLDLVSCRNLLIYFSPALQKSVIPSLHYSLRPGGYLVLGRSESIAGSSELFETIDKKQKVFRKLSPAFAAERFRLPPTRQKHAPLKRRRTPLADAPPVAVQPATREADKAVLAGFAPPGVTVDARLTIVEFRGETDPYLKHQPGRPSLNLLDMVRDELRRAVRTALAEADGTGTMARVKDVRLGKGSSAATVDLHVIPFTTMLGEAHCVVLFEETTEAGSEHRTKTAPKQAEQTEVELLRDELNETRERLEALVQDKEATNEELRAANEEMLSSGEEMQSVNEELETTQEELTSTNQELRGRNLELGQVSDDLSNLLTSVSFPIVMVGRDLCIRRFTPAATRLLKVLSTDVGRPITDLRLRIDVPDLEGLLTEVMDTMALTMRDVQDDEGRWYAMQLRPFKTLDNRIEGAVMTLFDIDEMKRMLTAQTSLSETLRQHYIHALPEIAELELAIVTETAQQRDLIGGDFHDVFALPDGKIVLAIGDVSGKGATAAGLAETTRVAIRATALLSPSPDAILRNVHRLVNDDSEQFVTTLVMTLDPSTGETLLASAGHPPPLHISDAGCTFVEPRFGSPLGSLESQYPSRRLSLARGDTLVLYTDGLTEAHRGEELFGEERLAEVLCNDGRRDPQSLVDAALGAAVGFAGELTDDVQILAARLT